jgi:hypothetical protein
MRELRWRLTRIGGQTEPNDGTALDGDQAVGRVYMLPTRRLRLSRWLAPGDNRTMMRWVDAEQTRRTQGTSRAAPSGVTTRPSNLLACDALRLLTASATG